MAVFPMTPATMNKQDAIEFEFAFNGKRYSLEINKNASVKDLKDKIIGMLGSPLENMKILGLRKGKVPEDNEILSTLKLAKKAKIIVLGYEAKDAPKSASTNQSNTSEPSTVSAFAVIENDIVEVEQFIAQFTREHGPRALDKTQNYELKKREEFLTQRLLKLDGLTVNDETRPTRKALVERIHRIHRELETMKMSTS